MEKVSGGEFNTREDPSFSGKFEILEKENINVEYLYAFVSSKTDEAIVVMRLENMEKAIEALNDSNVKILDENDIKEL